MDRVEVVVVNVIAAVLLGYCLWDMSFTSLQGVDVATLMLLAGGVFFPQYVTDTPAIQWLLRIVGCLGLAMMAFVTYWVSNIELI